MVKMKSLKWGASAAAVACLSFAVVPAHADRMEQHYTVQGKPLVTVRNANGRVQVKAWSKSEVQVVCTNVAGKTSLESEQSGNRIEFATHVIDEKVSGDDLKVDYEITVPVETELNVRTDSGNVTVESVHGDMTFDTVGANLQLTDVDGYMVIKTVDGSLQCNRCSGKLEANSISGNVQLLQPTLDSVRVQTTSGNILFDGSFLTRGIYIMKNFSGTIEVHFSPTDSFDLSASSLKGTVVNQASIKPDTHGSHRTLPKYGQSFIGTVNDGRAKVELSSFNGTIRILKRD
jgi:DUF4097 and DUF4098 domain-containing protein YvlB